MFSDTTADQLITITANELTDNGGIVENAEDGGHLIMANRFQYPIKVDQTVEASFNDHVRCETTVCTGVIVEVWNRIPESGNVPLCARVVFDPIA